MRVAAGNRHDSMCCDTKRATGGGGTRFTAMVHVTGGSRNRWNAFNYQAGGGGRVVLLMSAVWMLTARTSPKNARKGASDKFS